MRKTIIGQDYRIYENTIKRRLRRCWLVAVSVVLANLVLIVLRTEENHNWLMLLNILIDICGGWFIIGYVSLCVLPQKKLLSCLAKGKYYIEGSVIEVSQQSVRYMGLDCCEVHLAERRLFLPEDTLSLDAGEKYRFLLCGDIIVEVSSEDES